MNMKPISTIAACAAAALLAASCTVEEQRGAAPGRAISFRTFTENLTRATQVSQSTLDNFDVVAFSADGSRYFYDTFTDAGANAYTSAKQHFWPSNSAQLTFLAFNYDMMEKGELLESGLREQEDYLTSNFQNLSAAKLQSVTIPTDARAHVDFVVARQQASEQVSQGSAPQATQLNFRHALSQVRVLARNYDPNYKVEVAGVKLAHLHNVSDFTFPTSDTDANITSAQNTSSTMARSRWSTINTSDDQTSPVTAITGGTLHGHYPSFMYQLQNSGSPEQYEPLRLPTEGEPSYDDYQDLMGGQSFFVLPQKVTEWSGTNGEDGAYIGILCRISRYTGVGTPDAQKQDASGNWAVDYPVADGGQPDVKYAFTAIPVNVDWVPGKSYTYRLTFFADGGGGGLIDPDPIDPIDPTDPEVDPDPGEGGEELYGGPITFSVTVDEWVNVANDDKNMPR